jgi:putative exosortase-associated protein (TIGR04073 family)
MQLKALLLSIALMASIAPSAYAQEATGNAGEKLLRGAVNVCTGWVEIPKRIIETKDEFDWWTGVTWGLMRGIGHGFVRTAAGIYEVVTFPFAAPPGYAALIEPEYVFGNEPETGH